MLHVFFWHIALGLTHLMPPNVPYNNMCLDDDSLVQQRSMRSSKKNEPEVRIGSEQEYPSGYPQALAFRCSLAFSLSLSILRRSETQYDMFCVLDLFPDLSFSLREPLRISLSENISQNEQRAFQNQLKSS